MREVGRNDHARQLFVRELGDHSPGRGPLVSRGIKWNIAKPTWVEGIRFASKAEAKRYQQLRLLERAGAISGLEVQPCYPLEAVNPLNGEVTPVGVYKADFRYQENGRPVVEDVKGMRTVVYRLKKRIVEGQYGITITEVL